MTINDIKDKIIKKQERAPFMTKRIPEYALYGVQPAVTKKIQKIK
jgi:hypothetical protein